MAADNDETLCPYCHGVFAKHTRIRHIQKCFLKPENGKMLANFFLKGIDNINDISWTNTYRFTIKNKIITSSTIIIQTDSSGWINATIKLLLLFYEHNIIDDFELYDIIIGKLTNWSYSNLEEYNIAKQKYFNEYKSIDIVDCVPYCNYEHFYMAIIARAVIDYQFLSDIHQETYEEDGILIEALECLSFIELNAPLIYEKLIEQNPYDG